MYVILVFGMAKVTGNYVKLDFEILVQNCPKLHWVFVRGLNGCHFRVRDGKNYMKLYDKLDFEILVQKCPKFH